MAEKKPIQTRHDLEAKIIQHSWEDEAFRKEFIADPEGSFKKYLQVPAENLPKIVVHEEEPGTWHIVLPPKPANVKELSEADLERVAGGITPTITITLVTEVTALTLTASKAVTEAECGW